MEHGTHDAANNIYYVQFGMVPAAGNDLDGQVLLSSNTGNCAANPALFDVNTLETN